MQWLDKSYTKLVLRLFTGNQKNNASTIQSFVCNCFNTIKRRFCINMWQWMKHGSITSLWSQIGSQLSGQQLVKAFQSDQTGKVLVSMFWDVQGILFIKYIEKGRTINSEYYTIIGALEGRKTSSFTKTMHHVISQSQGWQNYMNWISNCIHTHPILQIWLPVTNVYLQNSKECSRERDLVLMKKWYWKLRRILRPKTNRSTKKASYW